MLQAKLWQDADLYDVDKSIDRPVCKPFLKWVGGKTQLLKRLDSALHPSLKLGEKRTYIEPFVGGGAVFFHVAQRYPIERIVISDLNPELVTAYRTIKIEPDEVIRQLKQMQHEYFSLPKAERAEYFYKTRGEFNDLKPNFGSRVFDESCVMTTARMIFLNRTCFNGLYRVNSSGQFNVSFGRYENPMILDARNIAAVSRLLQTIEIMRADFGDLVEYVDENSFLYLDPPYRPLNDTSSFTSYSPNTFTELDQQRLVRFCEVIDSMGAHFLLSNSDPRNINPSDQYFQSLFHRFNIQTVTANRMINCKATKRGRISELLISNY